jgi:hypothetical protein
MRKRWSDVLTARIVPRLPDLDTRRARHDIAIAGVFVLTGALIGLAIGILLAITLSLLAGHALQTTIIAYGIALAVCGAATGLVHAAVRRYPVFQSTHVLPRLGIVFGMGGFLAGACGGGRFEFALASGAGFLAIGVIVGSLVMAKSSIYRRTKR